MKTDALWFVGLVLILPAFIFTPFVMSGGFMLKDSICIYEKRVDRSPNDVEIGLLRFGKTNNLVVRNRTDLARKLLRNSPTVVEVEFQFRRVFPTYKIKVEIYSEYSDTITIYGRQQLSEPGQEKFKRLQVMLENEYGFTLRERNKDGYCDKTAE